MAAAAALAAAAPLVSGLMGAVTQQSHSPAVSVARHVDTSTAAIATARDSKQAKRLARNAREERIMALVTDPQVMGLLTVIGGVALSARIPFHDDPVTNARLQGLAAASCVLMGLGRAGVGDMTSLAMAAGAGGAVAASGGTGALIPNIPGTDVPVWALSGPGSIVWALQELAERT